MVRIDFSDLGFMLSWRMAEVTNLLWMTNVACKVIEAEHLTCTQLA